MTDWNGRRFHYFVFFLSVALLVATRIVSTSRGLSTGSLDVSTVILKEKLSSSVLVDDEQDYQRTETREHDFSYDKERWEKNPPRIVLLAGPHKTASTTLQDFFEKLTGLSISVKDNDEISITDYPNAEWVWPVGIKKEIDGEFRTLKSPNKFYASLTSFLSGRRAKMYFPSWKDKTEEELNDSRMRIAGYFRSLFGRPWKDGMKIVIGAESFDSLVLSLGENYTAASNRGEETHISPDSGDMIDILLDLLPFEENLNKLDANGHIRTPPLQLEDIEIHINYRTPRIDHVVSIWHQLGRGVNLKKFVMQMGAKRKERKNQRSFYQLNSLALALQFVRKGIKTTIVDMKGVFEMDSKNSTLASARSDIGNNATGTVVGGLQGVVACDILRMGIDNDDPGIFCDDQSKLHLSNYEVPVESKNKKKDKSQRRLTDKQMEDINRVFEEYDCGVWQHLKKYQEQGLLRILYPSDHLFERCKPDNGSPDISFYDSLLKTVEIASQSYGNETITDEDVV